MMSLVVFMDKFTKSRKVPLVVVVKSKVQGSTVITAAARSGPSWGEPSRPKGGLRECPLILSNGKYFSLLCFA